MGIEAYPFLKRVEIRNRRKIGKAVLRECFFEGADFLVIRSGVGPAKAASAINALNCGVDCFLSIGTAGALTPELRLGHIVVVNETIHARDTAHALQCDKQVVKQLSLACVQTQQPHIVRRLATSDRPVFNRSARAALNDKTLASAVDMESHAMAIAANNRGSRFAALRVISDTVDSGPLPERVDLRSLASNPAQIVGRLAPFMKWRSFMKQFFFAISKLDPVLINFIRRTQQTQEEN